jgi:hypothetical protein
MIRNSNEHETAKCLVDDYLKKPRSIVVSVFPKSRFLHRYAEKLSVVVDIVDMERQAIFNMINELPNRESRVIGVITKCDRKEENAAKWVCSATPWDFKRFYVPDLFSEGL